MTATEELNNELWSGTAGSISEAEMRAYLDGTLEDEKRRQLELSLSDNLAEADALEGLQQLTAAEREAAEARIQLLLRKRVKAMKRRRLKFYNDQKKTIVALIVIFILIMAGWYVIHIIMKK